MTMLSKWGGGMRGKGFKPAKPLLNHHTTAGQFIISNYDASLTYTISTTSGPTVTRSGNIITTTTSVTNAASITASQGLVSDVASVERRNYTYSSGGQTCSPNCGSAYQWPGNCYSNSSSCCNPNNSCWGTGPDGSCAADGTICCGGSRGSTCTPNPPVKNGLPGPAGSGGSAGWYDSYSEWWYSSGWV